MSKEQTEEILRSGGGRKDSRKRIYAKYQQGKSPEEITEFLKNEYGTTGKGFIFDDNPVAVWFDESGMRAGRSFWLRLKKQRSFWNWALSKRNGTM